MHVNTTARPAPADVSGSAGTTTDIQGLIEILRRHIGKVVVTTLVFMAVALLYALFSTKLYTSSAQLYVDPRPQRVVNEDTSLPGGSNADVSIVESQLSIITSQSVLGQVVDKLDLANDETFAPAPAPGRLAWLKQMIVGKEPSGMPALADPRVTALGALEKLIKVKRAQKSYIIEIEATARSPEKAARILQAVIDAYQAEQKATKQQVAGQANALIDATLTRLRDEVRKADSRVDEFKKNNRIVVSEGHIVGEQQLTRLNAELIAAQASVAKSKATFDQIELMRASGASPDAMPEAIGSAVIQRLRDQYVQAARREAALSSQLLPRHPVLIEARSQVREIRNQINSELRRIVNSISSEYRTALDRQREIERALETGKSEVARSTTALIQLRPLEQNATAARELLRTFLTRAQETREQQNTAVADARVVSQPLVPVRPSRPNTTLVLALGTLGGIGLGIAWALLAGQYDTAPRTPAQVQSTAGIRTLAVLPMLGGSLFRSGLRQRPGRKANAARAPRFDNVLSAVAGSDGGKGNRYRQAVLGLLRRLSSLARPGRPVTVMFIAPHAGAGCSAAAVSVAIAAAKLGERALLIDATSFDASVSRAFAHGVVADWSKLIKDKQQLASAVVRHPETGLAVLPLALADLGTLKIAERHQLADSVRALAQDYTLVVIDAGALVDDESPLMLLAAADILALVVRSGVSPAAALSETIRLLEPADRTITGAVLAMAPPDAATT